MNDCRHAPVFVIEVRPFDLCRLAGRAVHFIHDTDDPEKVLASVDIVDEGTRLTPTDVESHTNDGPLGHVTRTVPAGVCMACLDRHGRHVAIILVEEID